jgi:hypothetical protein
MRMTMLARGLCLALLASAGCTGGPISDFPHAGSGQDKPDQGNGDGDSSGAFDAGTAPADEGNDGEATPPDNGEPGGRLDGGASDGGASDAGSDAGDASSDGAVPLDDGGPDDGDP